MNSLYNWFFSRRKTLNLQIYEGKQAKKFTPGLYDFTVVFEYEGNIRFGSAEDYDRDLALEKACAEALERLAFYCEKARPGSPSVTSSGFAAHRTFNQASKRAINELIERDVFMCNVLSGAPLYEFDWKKLRGIHPSIVTMSKRLQDVGAELKIARLLSDHPQHVIVAAIFGEKHTPRFGVNIGLAGSLKLSRAVEKAAQEAQMMVLRALCGGEIKTRSFRNFNAIKKVKFENHRELGSHLKTAERYRSYFRSEKEMPAVRRIGQTTLDAFQLDRIDVPEFFATCPAVVVRAMNSDLQPLILGHPNNKNVNAKRVRTFMHHVPKLTLHLDYKNIHIMA